MTNGLEVALRKRVDLDQYGSNKRLLFALQLIFDIEDIATVAATSLTDHPNDKSCDLLYIDRGAGRVVLAQGYESENAAKLQAPARKAASLHQAINWLFNKSDPSGVPDALRVAWRELHDALADDAIGDVAIWYVHNLPESQQASAELRAARDSAYAQLNHGYPNSDIEVSCEELGRERLSQRYENSQTPILVSDTFTVEVPGAFEEHGDKWTALCTSVPVRCLHERFEQHGASLFSSNVRDYLGSRRSQSNINNGIQETVLNEPTNLWAYNNGITALVHDFSFVSGTVEITGSASSTVPRRPARSDQSQPLISVRAVTSLPASSGARTLRPCAVLCDSITAKTPRKPLISAVTTAYRGGLSASSKGWGSSATAAEGAADLRTSSGAQERTISPLR
ncbi:hypothetical protein GXP76_18765 [Streptomyces sp. NP-1717]|nr:hypothetical protein [Streptomyces sp. NP-1717]